MIEVHLTSDSAMSINIDQIELIGKIIKKRKN